VARRWIPAWGAAILPHATPALIPHSSPKGPGPPDLILVPHAQAAQRDTRQESRRAIGQGPAGPGACRAKRNPPRGDGLYSVEALLKSLPSPGQPRAFRYGVTVFLLFSLAAGAAAGPFEFLLLILPVLLASVLYDRGSGFFATGLGVLAMASQLEWPGDPVGHLVAITLFAIAALFIAIICEALRSALERGAAADRACRWAAWACGTGIAFGARPFVEPIHRKGRGSQREGRLRASR
jgi:hypothetical protein